MMAATVKIFPYTDRDMFGSGRVEWFAVIVDGQIIGRRRTREEAVELAEKRTYQTSTRPLQTILGASCATDFSQ